MANRSLNFSKEFENYDLPLHGVRLPSFVIENKFKREVGVSEDCDNEKFLIALCKDGLAAKKVNSNEYKDRLNYEFKTLKELGFIDYILLVWDVVKYCERNDIPTGVGRGSAAGSLVLYLIGVTGIDPVKNELFFERFVSKIRAKKQVVDGVTYLDGSLMCDVDMDICYYNRHKVLKYLEEKFEGRTSKILTLNTLSGKLCVKECGKVVDEKQESEMNRVSSLIPKVFGTVKDIKEAYEEVEEFKSWCDENPDSYKTALKLRGLVKNKGVHPSAVSISYEDMNDSCPVELTSDKESLVSSYDMNWVSIFNVKLDVLGLRSVSVVHDACKKIGITLDSIDLNSNFIYQQLQDLKAPHGLFQIEADTNFKVCQKVKPKNLEELSAVLALARPGALAFVDQYANYTNNGVNEPIHPFFDDILSSTGGVALYQEQLMKMAHKVGFTLDEAEILRRIVGKKKVSEVRKWKNKIKDKIKDQNLDPEIGNVLWDILEDSANYSFNKSHSISYAALAAITIYLKFKHPQEFFLSLLKMTRHESDPMLEISKINQEMDRFNMKLLPPNLIKSEMDFSKEEKDIRFGLLSIKGISDKNMEKLYKFKTHHSTKFDLFDAANKAGINISCLCALIQAGALEDDYGQSRSKVVYEAQLWNCLTDREKKYVRKCEKDFNYNLVKIIKSLCNSKDDKGKPIIKESRMSTLTKKSTPYLEIYNINKKSESFANWYYEKNSLGYTYNRTLRSIFSSKRNNLATVREVCDAELGTRHVFVGYVSDDPYKGISRSAKKSKYLRLNLSDETGTTRVMIFNQKMEECKLLNGGFPKKNQIVVVKGAKFEDVIFADSMTIQDNKVYTKFSELKNDS